jgi:replication factor C subunit 2/4
LNASDDRGINIIRTRVKDFAQIATAGQNEPDYPCPPYKLVVLDEADSMTVDAQSALRRTMETYSKSTRFCLICNYVTRIIEPLASRCVKFRYKPLSADSMKARIQYIAQQESFEIPDQALNQLIRVSGGDMRRAINLLQSAYQLDGNVVTDTTIVEISGVSHFRVILILILV